jgi:hypothetical protein
MKGGQSQQGFGSPNMPSWLGMAGQYGGGGYGGYGGYGGQGMAGPAGQMGGPPMMTPDFSQGAGLYQANQAAPYYAGGQPPPQPGQPGTPSSAIGSGGTASGGLLGTGAPMDTVAGPGGLLNGAGYPGTTNQTGMLPQNSTGMLPQNSTGMLPQNSTGMMPSPQNPQAWMSQWHNRGYGVPGMMPPGQAGGNMSPGAYYGLFGGGGY